MKKILIADDDNLIRQFVKKVLQGISVDVIEASNGREAVQLFKEQRPDMVLLDINMPILNGLHASEKIRQESPLTPILMVTARKETEDKVNGLEFADDYLTKPFDPAELLARVKTALRRQDAISGKGAPLPEELQIHQLKLYLKQWKAQFGEIPLKLSKTEFNLLKTFCLNPNEVLERDYLLKEVWQYEISGQTRTVDNFVMRLRKKLQSAAEGSSVSLPRLETIYGVGYRLKTE